MKRSGIIASLFLLFLPFILGAQTLTNKERREMNSTVLTLVKDYERYAALHDEEAEHLFFELFEGNDACVFCDVPGIPYYQMKTSLLQYMDILKNHARNTSVVIKDVSKGKPYFSDGKWVIPVYFWKELSYMNESGYFFSVEEYHGTPVRMTMKVVYDKETDRCHIRSINGEITSDRQFPEGRYIILNRDEYASAAEQEYYSSLTVGGEAPVYNRYGQAILPSGEAMVEDPDVEVKSSVVSPASDYDVMAYWFHMKNARFRLRASYSPFVYLVDAPDDISTRSKSLELGLEYGVAYPMGSKSKFSINSGVGMALSTLHLNGQDRYQRVRYLDLSVPVYAEFEHRFCRPASFVWNVGLKGYYEVKTSQGYSRENPYDLALTANLGIDLNLLQNKIYGMVRCGYEFGFFSHGYGNVDPYSLMNGVSLRRGTVWLSAGIKFKL